MNRPRPPRRSRGSAAVEVLLSVPFIFLFAITIVDFTRGQLTASRAHRAARHVAWCAARHRLEASHPAAPSAEDVDARHFEGRPGVVGVSSTHETLESPFADDAIEGVADALESMPWPFSVDLENFGRGVFFFFAGKVDVERGTVTKEVTGVRAMFSGGDFEANHWVSLDSRREPDPADPYGWWDPYQDLIDAIEGLFDL
jgi:hypothetical protein